MKNLLFAVAICVCTTAVTAQEFKIVTTIESVVPGGLGRSRMIQTDDSGKSQEVKMQNYFSMVGINFGNITENDQMIALMLGDMTSKGWELITTTPGVYSADKSTGLFITRYVFKRDTGDYPGE